MLVGLVGNWSESGSLVRSWTTEAAKVAIWLGWGWVFLALLPGAGVWGGGTRVRSMTVLLGRVWVEVGWGGSGGSLRRDDLVLRWFVEFASGRGLFGLVPVCGGGAGW